MSNEGRVLAIGTLESSRHGIEDEAHSCSVVDFFLAIVSSYSPTNAVCYESELKPQVVDGMAHSSFGHQIFHRVSPLRLDELRVYEVPALLDFGFSPGLGCEGINPIMSRSLFFAPTHPDAVLLELTFQVELLVCDALTWETCERYAWVASCHRRQMDASSCRGITCVLPQKRTRNELALDFEFGDDRTVAESFAG